MPLPISVEQLEVIGYADSLLSAMVPSVVPPVFRFRDHPDRVLVPPFMLNGGFVCGASEITGSEARQLGNKGEIVLFEPPVPAQSGFELWMSESGPRYESRTLVKNTLRRLARQFVEQAEIAFRGGDTEGAEQLCSAAVSADDRSTAALAIKGAIRRQQGDAEGERLMAELTEAWLEPAEFKVLVDHYAATPNQPAPIPPHFETSRLPMRGMAAYPAAA